MHVWVAGVESEMTMRESHQLVGHRVLEELRVRLKTRSEVEDDLGS